MPDYSVYLTIEQDPSGVLPVRGAQYHVHAETPEHAVRMAVQATNLDLQFPSTIVVATATCADSGATALFDLKRHGLPPVH